MTVEPIRKVLPYLSVAVAIAAIYVAYTFYSRRDADQRLARAEASKEREADLDTLRRVGGVELKITGFYATPKAIGRGDTAKLCYGVTNAKRLALEPPVERVWPSLSRCFAVAPKVTTRYTLSAWGENGKPAEQTTEISVR